MIQTRHMADPAFTKALRNHGQKAGHRLADLLRGRHRAHEKPPLCADEIAKMYMELSNSALSEGIAFFRSRFGMLVVRPDITTYDDPLQSTWGEYDMGQRRISINIRTPMPFVRYVTLHELGHHINYIFSGNEFYRNEALDEGRADFFSASAMFSQSGSEAIDYMIRFLARKRIYLGYTLAHYNSFYASLVEGARTPPSVKDPTAAARSEKHELGVRLLVMYCLGSGKSLNDLVVPVMTQLPSTFMDEFIGMLRMDKGRYVAQRIEAYPELTCPWIPAACFDGS